MPLAFRWQCRGRIARCARSKISTHSFLQTTTCTSPDCYIACNYKCIHIYSYIWSLFKLHAWLPSGDFCSLRTMNGPVSYVRHMGLYYAPLCNGMWYHATHLVANTSRTAASLENRELLHWREMRVCCALPTARANVNIKLFASRFI